MLLFILFVLSALLFHLLSVRLSRPRVIYEVALSEASWKEIRQFWEAAGRLQ